MGLKSVSHLIQQHLKSALTAQRTRVPVETIFIGDIKQ